MQVKEQNLPLVIMAIITCLKLCHLEYVRCLLPRKGECWSLGVEGGPEMKTKVLSLPKRIVPSENVLCCKNIFLGHFLILVELQRRRTQSPEGKTKDSVDKSESLHSSSVSCFVPLISELTQVLHLCFNS